MNRRSFLQTISAVGAASLFPSSSFAAAPSSKKPFDISLSQWSFHRAMFGNSRDNYAWYSKTLHSDPDQVLKGDTDPRDIVVLARKLGVSHVDLVNVLWFGHAQDKPWLNQFKELARNEGVGFVCLMCDELGNLGSSNAKARTEAIENHLPWIEAAAELNCTQFRVNAYGDGTYLDQLEKNAESMHRLAEITKPLNLKLVIENHGHPSSNAAWLAMLIEKTAHPNVGVLTDFDNFFMGGWGHEPERRYDRTQGLIDLAPYTHGVSAKSHDFDKSGQETTINYLESMKLLVDAGFNGYASAEYEGYRMSEYEGTKATIDLLREVQYELALI